MFWKFMYFNVKYYNSVIYVSALLCQFLRSTQYWYGWLRWRQYFANIPYEHLLECIEFDDPPLSDPQIPSHIQGTERFIQMLTNVSRRVIDKNRDDVMAVIMEQGHIQDFISGGFQTEKKNFSTQILSKYNCFQRTIQSSKHFL